MSKTATDPSGATDLLSGPLPEWMVPLDVRVLEFLERVDVPVLPGTIAYNLDRDRPDVVSRTLLLSDFGLLVRESRTPNAFRISSLGSELLAGEIDPFTLDYESGL